MNFGQEKSDVSHGYFILEQYKLRKELGLLKFGNPNVIESICSKYSKPNFLFDEEQITEIKDGYVDFKQSEFDRVLIELRRREELIQELLTKLERYETASRDSETQVNSVQSEFFNKEESNIVIEEIRIDIKKSGLSYDNLCLWRSLLNSNRDVTNYNKCAVTQEINKNESKNIN
ncbi:hypothetical protein FG386_003647 [Cryptosporidium ryanae]|uniref:uncharacterized protein n=1 Tax=Cryptosporidium ryanae TaxID=515981 RepID=UPI00351A04BF|nr:hypothetical protein FG386_003647 [Cryptosporidium ryanae]